MDALLQGQLELDGHVQEGKLSAVGWRCSSVDPRRGIRDVHPLVGKVVDGNVSVTTLRQGIDVLDAVDGIDVAIVLLEDIRHARVGAGLGMSVDVDQTLHSRMGRVLGVVVIRVDVNSLVRVFDGSELVADAISKTCTCQRVEDGNLPRKMEQVRWALMMRLIPSSMVRSY